MLGIDELIVFNVESTAHWRRQTAEKFPEDNRNAEAADILERLSPQLRALEGSALHGHLAQLAEQDEDGNFSSIVSELLRTVGFRSFPDSGEEFIRRIIELLGSARSRPAFSPESGTLILRANPPPQLPAQGIGPHVEINDEGIIGFAPAESLDREGNYLPRLRALQSDLRELACELAASLSKGNAPHAVLGERVASYAALINQDLQTIDFHRLYSAGVRLANAAHATDYAISTGELPPLELREREKLDSLLDLHAPFIMSTAAGLEAVADEERYQRRPAEERRYRADAVAVAEALQGRSDLIDLEVAKQLLGAAEDIGQGRNPERSTVTGRAMMRNVMIVVASGAMGSATLIYAGSGLMLEAGRVTAYVGMLVVSETIKKTSWFQSLTKSMASKVDNAMDGPSKEAAEKFRSSLRRHNQFIMANESTLRRLVGTRKEFRFLRRALDWLKENGDR